MKAKLQAIFTKLKSLSAKAYAKSPFAAGLAIGYALGRLLGLL